MEKLDRKIDIQYLSPVEKVESALENSPLAVSVNGLCILTGLPAWRIIPILKNLKRRKRVEIVTAKKSTYWRARQ